MSSRPPTPPPGLEYLDETLAAYSVFGTALRPRAKAIMRELPKLIPADRRVVTFFQATRRDLSKARVVLVLTDSQLGIVDEDTLDGELFARSECSTLVYERDGAGRVGMTLETPAGTRRLRHVVPGDEGLRLAVALGYQDPSDHSVAVGIPTDPGCPPLAYCWQLTLYPDRLIDQDRRHLPLNGPVRATVDTAGGLTSTRGRDLAAKGIGTLLLGPVGLFTIGNARTKTIDTRELYLLIEGPEWVYTQRFVPEMGDAVRRFAGLINLAARRRSQPAANDW